MTNQEIAKEVIRRDRAKKAEAPLTGPRFLEIAKDIARTAAKPVILHISRAEAEREFENVIHECVTMRSRIEKDHIR